MVRLAQEQDLSWLIQAMLHVKRSSAWRDETTEYNEQSLRDFLTTQLHNSHSVCYVWQADDDRPEAFCGVLLQRLVQPPHMPLVSEWGWAGPTRQAVKCWRACTQWGKKQGAVYGYRVTASNNVHPRRITESVTWEKL